MGRVAKMLIVAALLLSPELVQAVDGTTWRSYSENVRASYVVGVVDAWIYFKAILGDPEKLTEPREMTLPERFFLDAAECALKMKYGQHVAIVDKFMNDHPERWNHGMADIIWKAMNEACKK